jgi:predicted  nucleic acid-binding Zn-ribbon protein
MRPIIEFGGTDRRTVVVGGRAFSADQINLRMLGCPNWLATKIETREASKAKEEQFRAKARKRLEAAMSDDEDVRRRARAEALAEEIAEDEDDVDELNDDERCLIRALRQVKRQKLSASAVS